MREQPQHTDILTKEFFQKYYVEERWSYQDLQKLIFRTHHRHIVVSTIHSYAKKLGFGRTRSEAKRNQDPNPLDYSQPVLSNEMIEAVDGFLLGDGGIEYSRDRETNIARFQCTLEHQEFALYLMSHWPGSQPSCIQVNSPKSPSGKLWQAYTRFHPDFYAQLVRWYPESKDENRRIKEPPPDIQITPKSVMMWYLGDGSCVNDKGSVQLRLSTDGFSERGVEFLAQKLQEKGIACHRNNDNRIYIEAKGIPKFFDFIGRTSPVKCYEYKFDLPEWRYTAKRMSEVAEELGIPYGKLNDAVKAKKVAVFREHPEAKPRFLPEHIEALRASILNGEFYKDRRKEKKS